MIKKQIKGFKGYYIDLDGNVYGNKKLKQHHYGDYLYVRIKNKLYRVDKLMAISFFKRCTYSSVKVKHINNFKTDNQLYNLDLVRNYLVRKYTIKSKFRGVSFCKRNRKWKAFYKNEYLGLFSDEYDSFIAYENAKEFI